MRPAGAFRERVYEIVRLIPHGNIATYGYVALLAGAPRQARQVGWALHTLPPGLVWGAEGGDARRLARARVPSPKGTAESIKESTSVATEEGTSGERGVDRAEPSRVPWHRVINAQGRVSTHPDAYGTHRQIELLRAEQIDVTDDGTLVLGLEAHRWWPGPALVDALALPAELLFTLEQR